MLSETSKGRSDRSLLGDLSAVGDGEASRGQVARVCEAWREDTELQRQWHTWAVIGDALRSDDLAGDVVRDQCFLDAFRKRMAQEPVVLAPMPLAAEPTVEEIPLPLVVNGAGSARLRGFAWRWAAPTAVVAGFVAVAGVMVATRSGEEAATPAGAVLASGGQTAMPGATGVIVVRNPQIDTYLNAHRQYSQAPSLVTPGGLRQVAVTPDGR